MSKHQAHPPKLAVAILKRFLRPDFQEDVLGDLEENFAFTIKEKGLLSAVLSYWYQTFNYLRPFAIKKSKSKTSNKFTMLKHFIKLSWRNLKKQKVFSSIEVGGFAIGIAACILIFLFIQHQTGYDQHYEKGDQIFRVVNRWSEEGDEGYWSNVHGPLKEVLEDNIPEIEKVARIVQWGWGDSGENHVRPLESDFNYYHGGFIYADPELLDILETSMSYGSRYTALSQPNSMVISQRIAEQYYPGEDPVGKQMILNDNQSSIFTIGGVMDNLPINSHLQVDFILTLFERKSGPGTSGWCCTNYNMYTRLTPQADKAEVEIKTRELRNTFVIERRRELGANHLEEEIKYQSYYLQPVQSIYLNPEEVTDELAHGSSDLVWIFGVVAIIVLLLACINFVNLATARSMKRAKEVGILKSVGSFRSELVFQYLVESIVYCLLAISMAVLIAWIILPYFNALAGITIFIPWYSSWFIPGLIGIGVLIGVLSGLYPAFYLSRFQPVEVLKGKLRTGKKASILNNALVIFQFVSTVILIVCAIAMHQQFKLLMTKSLGYEKEHVLNVLGLETMDDSRRRTVKEAFKSLPGIEDASLSDYLPVAGGAIQNRTFWLSENRKLDGGFEAARWVVDEDYLATMKMKLVIGQNFTSSGTEKKSIIINEEMQQVLGLKNSVGQQVIDMFDETYTIIGVVKDFHFESLINEIRPLAMVYGSGRSTLSLKIKGDNIAETMTAIHDRWDQFNPNQTIRYAFMDHRYELMYNQLNRAKTVFLVFAMLSILVACLGLFALSMYLIEMRGKEISVRKVLGASVSRIFLTLTFDFVSVVLISILLAMPIAWYFMDYLLEDMATRIDLSWDIFSISGIIALLIAFATVSVESIRAALVNPTKKLRSE